jgi:hypothetical protein
MFRRIFIPSVAALTLVVASACVGDDSDYVAPAPAACEPTTCQAAGKNCGSIDDGCGGSLACGECAAPQTCGGGGRTNVCGVSAATITSVTIPSRGDNQIRQGTEPGVTVVATGTNLMGAFAAFLGSLEVEITAAASTASSVTLVIAIPHGGMVPGPAPLLVKTPQGDAQLHDAITVTPITASAASGNDATGDGTTAKPYKTYKKAASEVESGDTLFLEDGTYDAANGEEWPDLTSLAFGAYAAPATVPDGVTIKGKSAAGTKLVGPGRDAVGLGSKAGLVFDGSINETTIESLTVSGFGVGILDASAARLVVKDVIVEDGSDNIYVRGPGVSGGEITLTNVVSRTARSAGIATWNAVKVTVTGGRISKNDLWGIFATSSGALSITGTEIDENDFSGNVGNNVGGILASGLNTKALGPITISNAKFHDNKRNGIDVRETVGPVALTITGSEFRREAVYAIGFGSNVNAKLRNTTIELPRIDSQCVNSGIYFGSADSTLDLGTAAENGDNVFVLAPEGSCYALYNVRPADAAAPVTMKATSFTNTAAPVTPAAGCSAATNDRKWFIGTGGTCPDTGNVIQSF